MEHGVGIATPLLNALCPMPFTKDDGVSQMT